MIKKQTTIIYKDENGFNYTFEPIEDTLSIKETDQGFEARYLTIDKNPLSPDEFKDDSLYLVHYHRDFWIEDKERFTRAVLSDIYQGNPDEDEAIADLLKDYYVFPVSALIHSGVWLSLSRSFNCDSGGWDTSHVGAIVAAKSEFKTEDQALKCAQGLLEEWNQLLSNEVYCIVKETYSKDKTPIDYDIVGNFYGYNYAKECLKTEI